MEYYDEPEFGQEFAALERTGAVQQEMDDFETRVDAVCRSLRDRNIGISDDDMTVMIDTAKRVKYKEKKNPSAYVGGFIASRGGQRITEQSTRYVFERVLPFLDPSASVKQEDVIRYARLWMNLK